jgi:hypothetical protein
MKRPSPALLVSLVALFIALGGTSYAAITSLPKNSVGTPQLKTGAVTAPKINASALLHPSVYALVNNDGTVDASQSSGIAGAGVRKVNASTFCISGLPLTPKGGSATIYGSRGLNATGEAYLMISDTGQAADCLPGEPVEVVTNFDGQPNPESFYLVLYG